MADLRDSFGCSLKELFGVTALRIRTAMMMPTSAMEMVPKEEGGVSR